MTNQEVSDNLNHVWFYKFITICFQIFLRHFLMLYYNVLATQSPGNTNPNPAR